ncbi:MAG: hypothetical protein H0T52_12200 [Lautropia sp.]|nr:hypothetical protein [Lautropia sp.]
MKRTLPAALCGLAMVTLLAACVMREPVATSTSPGPSDPRAPAPAVSPPADLSSPGSATLSPVSPGIVPARLQAAAGGGKGATPQCLAQIEAFAELHSGNRVILGHAAFADSDELVLARMPRRGADGLLLDGRAAVPQPVVLKLLAGPDGCFVRLADATFAGAQLPACACTAVSR